MSPKPLPDYVPPADRVEGFILSRAIRRADRSQVMAGALFVQMCPRCTALVGDLEQHARVCQ